MPESAENAETTEVASQPAVNTYTALQRRYRQFLAIIRSGETPDAQDLQDFFAPMRNGICRYFCNETTLPPNTSFRMSHPDIPTARFADAASRNAGNRFAGEWQYRTVRKHLQTGEPANLADVFTVIPPPLKILLILPSHAYQPVDEESRQPYYEKRLREMLPSLISGLRCGNPHFALAYACCTGAGIEPASCHIVYYWGGGAGPRKRRKLFGI
ncbi:MAG: hypothetical protein R3C26_13435 [Calditrichia bacterium]